MPEPHRSILVLGESNVGKTHFGAQLLKRLIVGQSALKMDGQATNLAPYEAAMASLADGKATGHTPTEVYVESLWPVIDQSGRRAHLIWPDYGGEQIRKLTTDRIIPVEWRNRVIAATDWVLLIRLHTLQATADIFSRPLSELGASSAAAAVQRPSDQARLIELLQMLLYIAAIGREHPVSQPKLTVLLSCWDEVKAPGLPEEALESALPMFSGFIGSVWSKPTVLGLSALGKALSDKNPDDAYSARGPEKFGYVVHADGKEDSDLAWPIARLLEAGEPA